MVRRFRLLLLSSLLLLACAQLGSASLIYAKAWLAPLLLEQAWQDSLSRGGEPTRPWPWADTWPVARLLVPSLGVSNYILAGDTGHALAFGPGHSEASADLGGPGQAVIGGHRDTHFAFLQDLELQQRLTLQLPDGRLLEYEVETLAVIDSSRQLLQVQQDEEQLLLVTCYPFDALSTGGPLRYVVGARPVVSLVATTRAVVETPQHLQF